MIIGLVAARSTGPVPPPLMNHNIYVYYGVTVFSGQKSPAIKQLKFIFNKCRNQLIVTTKIDLI